MIVRELLTVFGLKYDDKAAKTATASIDMLARKAGALAGIFATGALVNGIKNFVHNNIEMADKIGKTSAKLGITAEALQELRFAAEQSGVAQSSLDTALQRFIRRSAEAANGTGIAKDALVGLGVQLTDSAGKLKTPGELLAQVADGFANVESQSERVRLAFKLFDTEGVAMVNMLQGGSGAIKALRNEARALGSVIGSESVLASEKLSDQFNRVRHVMLGLGNNIVHGLMPAFSAIARVAVFVGKSFANMAKQTTLLRTAFVALGVIAAALGVKLAIAFAPAIVVFAAVAAGAALIALVVDDLINAFSGGESFIKRFAFSLKDGFLSALASIKDSFLEFKEWLLDGMNHIAGAGSKLLSNLVPDFVKSGFEATASFLGLDKSGKTSKMPMVSRALSNRTSNQSIYSPMNQSVRVDVNVNSSANPREIGGQVAKMVRRELESERKNAFEGLVQFAPEPS